MNRKKRILFCSEATFLNTGYATYTREILNYLHGTGKYELAEMASYGERNDPRASSIPWRYYGVVPNQNCEPKAQEQELREYQSKPTNQFGEMLFEHVCLDFLPDIVCDIRDFWMVDHEERSPLRPYYKWVLMPTVDAAPQARQWIATYQSSDACLTYSDWAGGVLKKQSGNKINYQGSAPPSAHPAYKPVQDKDAHRKKFGLDPDIKIIGTVMRNQRRKLYPDLFEAFKKFTLTPRGENAYLYCHTSYPDLGWDIPELLQEHGIASRVYFTYICPETKKPFPSLFRGPITQSPYTGKFGAGLSNVKIGASYEDLSDIMNLFDLYVQYANCEGFGLPQVEAAACAVPVMGTDYSAMESVLRKLQGFPIKPKALYKELETGCMRAVPDNDLAASMFAEFFSKSKEEQRAIGQQSRSEFERYYQWDLSGRQWEKCFDLFEVEPIENTWGRPANIRQPASKPQLPEGNLNYKEIARWLIGSVLCDESKMNSFLEARLVRDLTYQTSTATTGGMYFNESSAAFDGQSIHQPFSFDMAYEHFKQFCNHRNMWEQRRVERMKYFTGQ